MEVITGVNLPDQVRLLPPERQNATVPNTNNAVAAEQVGARPTTDLGTFGRFVLCELLGRGAYGRVYRAYDPQLERFVALKLPTFGPDEVQKFQRFFTEAKAAARLRHPNIVTIYESGRIADQYFTSFEYVPGQSLSHWIKKDPGDFHEVVDWTCQLADALAYAHSQGIVHRDIKPGNIIVDANRVPLITDFGLAKLSSADSALTIDGSVLGTPAYMSPEQARGELDNVGPHSDQYSLGVVLYELLSGKRPFSGEAHSVIAQVAFVDPPRLCSLSSAIPPALEAICQKAMSKSSRDRYASCSELAADLSRWLHGMETYAQPFASRQHHDNCWYRRRAVAAGLALAVIALLLILVEPKPDIDPHVPHGNPESSIRVVKNDPERKPEETSPKLSGEGTAELRSSDSQPTSLSPQEQPSEIDITKNGELELPKRLAERQAAQEKARKTFSETTAEDKRLMQLAKVTWQGEDTFDLSFADVIPMRGTQDKKRLNRYSSSTIYDPPSRLAVAPNGSRAIFCPQRGIGFWSEKDPFTKVLGLDTILNRSGGAMKRMPEGHRNGSPGQSDLMQGGLTFDSNGRCYYTVGQNPSAVYRIPTNPQNPSWPPSAAPEHLFDAVAVSGLQVIRADNKRDYLYVTTQSTVLRYPVNPLDDAGLSSGPWLQFHLRKLDNSSAPNIATALLLSEERMIIVLQDYEPIAGKRNYLGLLDLKLGLLSRIELEELKNNSEPGPLAFDARKNTIVRFDRGMSAFHEYTIAPTTSR